MWLLMAVNEKAEHGGGLCPLVGEVHSPAEGEAVFTIVNRELCSFAIFGNFEVNKNCRF